MDVLTDVLDRLRLEPTVVHRLRLRAPWGMALKSQGGTAFHVIERGDCWLRMPRLDEPLHLNEADLIAVTDCEEYELLDRPDSPVLPLHDLLSQRNDEGIISPLSQPDGAESRLLCGEFRGERQVLSPLFSALPPLIHIPSNQGRAVEWLAAPFDMIAFEVKYNYPGRDTVISHLMNILFIMVVRYWIAHPGASQRGWLNALYHPQIGEVLALMHRQPELPWTVEALAAGVNMSRSSLANQFTELVGESPIQYLTRWRMRLAMLRLRDSQQHTIEKVATSLGYTSAYAFSKAFKRVVGVAPSEYRRQSIKRTSNGINGGGNDNHVLPSDA